MRQLTQNNTYQQPLGPTDQAKGGYTTKQDGTVAPPTLRQLTQNNTYQQPLGPNDHARGGYTTQQDGTIAPPTMRQMTQNNTYQQPLGPNDHAKGGYTTQQDGTIAPPTMRQMTQNNTYQNPLGTQEHEKGGYTAEQDGTIAPATLRQLTQNNTYQNPLGFSEKQRGRRDAHNSLVNITREVVAQGRYPTTSNYDKGPINDFTQVRLCEPIQINRELYGTRYGQNVNQCIPTMYTKMGYVLPQTGWRSYTSHIGNNLSSNPFVNNTQHKSVTY